MISPLIKTYDIIMHLMTHMQSVSLHIHTICSGSVYLFALRFYIYYSVKLLCMEYNAPCLWNLAIDKAKPPTSATKWQGTDQTDLQCQAARHCHHQIQWATCAAWHWGSGSHSEGAKAPLVWTCGTLQWCSQDSLWHTGWCKAWAWEAQDDMEATDRERLQRVEALGY